MSAPPVKQVQIGVVGRGMVGKTALIQRFRKDEFITEYIPTEYEVFCLAMALINELIKMNIGDAGGGPSNQELIDKNISASDGFILVYDITRKETFDALSEIRDHLIKVKGVSANLPLVLVGNKVDLEARRFVVTNRGSELVERWRCPFYETSALTGQNVNEIFIKALSEIEEKRKHPIENNAPTPTTTTNKCCNIL